MSVIKCKDCDCYLEKTNVRNVRDNYKEYKCLCYNKNDQRTFDEV